jgi:hypothetical protein
MPSASKHSLALWTARLSVGLVFVINISCAVAFIWQPERYAPGFELTGLPGQIAVQGFGILFLMWNATYPAVLFHPVRNKTLFVVILVQQLTGLIGETWLWVQLPEGHQALQSTGLRFILFDGFGLVLMGAAFIFLSASLRQKSL